MHEACVVETVLYPVRREYPIRVRCLVCGWIDTFATVDEASGEAVYHEEWHVEHADGAEVE